MTAPVRVRVTEEDYLATMTGVKPSLEFVNGEVFQKPMVRRSHQKVSHVLNRVFVHYEEEQGGLWAWETTTNVSDGPDRRYRVPDMSYWAPGRPIEQPNEIFLPPTLAIEVRSEGQSMRELRDKCREYRERGVDVCWLIDPFARTVEVFEGELDGQPLPLGMSLSSPHVPGFELPLRELWAALD